MTTLVEALHRLPRIRLAQLPTPLQPAPRLSQALGGPAIYFKRDDLTGNPVLATFPIRRRRRQVAHV